MSTLPPLRLLLVLLLPLSTAGCGYKASLTLPEGYGSVGAEIFDNQSARIDLERDLATYLSRSLRDFVEAPLVSPTRADLVVSGTILEYRRLAGIRSEDNELLETGLQIQIEAWLLDPLTQERISKPLQKTMAVGYSTQAEFGEEGARARALAYLAEWAVLALFASQE